MVGKRAYRGLRQLVDERDWAQFHAPENLAKGISIEAAELVGCCQWSGEVDFEAVKAELADVLTYCFLLADKLGLDAEAIVLEKLEQKKATYPVEKSRGNDGVGPGSLTPRCIKRALYPIVFRCSVV